MAHSTFVQRGDSVIEKNCFGCSSLNCHLVQLYFCMKKKKKKITFLNRKFQFPIRMVGMQNSSSEFKSSACCIFACVCSKAQKIKKVDDETQHFCVVFLTKFLLLLHENST